MMHFILFGLQLEYIQNIRMIMLGAQSILQKSMAPPIRIPNAGDWLQEMYNKVTFDFSSS